jgi:hypothetical protein
MAYKIVKNPRAWWPVTFNSVSEEGEIVENKFEMRFRILDEDELAELTKLERKIDVSEAVPSEVAAEIVLKIAEDWKGILDDDGSDAGASLAFTPANVAMLMKVPNVYFGVAAAFRACRAGVRPGN